MALKEKITFKDLSTSLQFLVIAGWFMFGIFVFYFFIGFFSALSGVPLD